MPSQSDTNLPLVSMFMPLYRRRFFEQALLCAINQTYKNIEILIYDNNGKEPFSESVRTLINANPHVTYIDNGEDIGPESFRRFYKRSKGYYIKPLYDDDLLDPNAVTRMVEAFESFGEGVTLVTSKRNLIDENGTILSDISATAPLLNADGRLNGLTVGNHLLSTMTNFIGEPSTAMYRKTDVSIDSLYCLNHRPYLIINDITTWLWLMSKGDIVYLTEPLSSFRIHADQEQKNPKHFFRATMEWHHVFIDALPIGYLQDLEIRKNVYKMLLNYLCHQLQPDFLPQDQSNQIISAIQDVSNKIYELDIPEQNTIYSPLKIATIMVGGSDACPMIRLKNPLSHLESALVVQDALVHDQQTNTFYLDSDIINKSDILLIQRHSIMFLTDNFIDQLQNSGKKIILEIDDLLTDIPETSVDKTSFADAVEPLIRALQKVDLITVSTPALKEEYSRYNDNIVVLPNYLEMALWEQPFISRNHPKLVIGYMGTPSHEADLKLIEEALVSILNEFPDKVSFKFFGCITETLKNYSNVEYIEAPESIAYHYEAFAAFMKTLDFDIGIAPLCDNTFNRCKSHIKFLEYSICSIPGIYSDLPAYSSIVEKGKNGLLCSSSEEWTNSLRQLILDDALRASIAQQAYDTVVRDYDLSTHANEWLKTYQNLVQEPTNVIKITQPQRKIIAYLSDPFDNDNFLDLTLNILSPISNLKDYSIEPLLQKRNGRYHIRTDILSTVKTVIIYDKAAYLSHLIPKLKAYGIPVVFMVHTDVWHVDVKHSNKEALDLLRPHYSECIKNADVIVTSNEYISHYIGAENKVITPFIDSSPWKFPIEKLPRFSDKFTLAVYVDMQNLNDISMIAKFIQTIQKKYSDELYFVVHGINCSPNELEALNFVDVKLTKIDNYLQYINFIRTQPIDAVLTPLLANQHNLTISPFNYFINALSDVVGIYSNWGLYKEVVQHGATGFLCGENELDWEAAIVTLMHYPDTRQQICEAAKKQVLENFTIDHTLRNIYDLLESLSAHKIAVDQVPRELEKSFTRYELKSLLSYPAWCEIKALQYIDIKEWELLSDRWETMPSFHFFINVNALKLDKLADTIESFIAQLYPEWNLYLISPDSSPNPLFDQHPKLHWIQTEVSTYDAVNHVMGEMQNGMIGFLEAGDRLQPHGLAAYSELYNHTKYHLIYADHDTINGANRIYPQFKPDFNLDMFRSNNYIARSFVISSMALKELGGIDSELRDGELFDLILRYIDHFGESAIAHYNDILHSCILNDQERDIDLSAISSKIALKKHLLRNGLSGDVVDNKENSFRILYHHETKPLVSIIIPTKNQYHYLRPCIESILKKTAYDNYEIIIVDNNSDEKDAIEYLKSLKKHKHIQVVPYNKPFNYSTANNIGAKHAQGEFLLLLNNDTEILHENWLDVLLSYGQRNDVGIVGPRLIYPNQTIQHAGVIVGLNNIADHQFIGADLDDPGYMSRLQIDQNLSAVTAAAMLVKRTAFDAVLGLNDTDYGVNFSDIDLCLKIFSAGYKIIYTPHATLLHHGSVTQKNIDSKKRIEKIKLFMSDQHAFWTKWQDIILNDPSYNTNLDTSDAFMPIRLKALAHWNPLLKSPIPKIFGMSRGHDGGGFYRITSPLQGLQSLAKAQTSFVYKNYTAPYIAMQQPDIIIYQTPLHDNMITFLEYIKTYHPNITLIFEIDDLLTNIPIDNRAFHKQYKDTKKRMVKGLKYCDRMVVSTQPLKDAFQSYIDDIRIIPNYLPKSVWGDLHSKRNRSEKLRIGWAGSIFHKGDLAIISKLVENYHDAVEWVFFGMAPEGLDGKIEFHPGVSLDLYPEKLATLDLDLALVPLEDNAFNAAKSNLRLLEFGILGWPVICSDVYPYQEAPVTRVKNRYKDWEKAFLSKISDLEVLKNEGDQLKKWVKDNYILEDHVDFIYQQYTEQKK